MIAAFASPPGNDVLAFIGGGNMAGSLIGGWLAAGHAPATVRVLELSGTRAAELRQRYEVDAGSDPGLLAGADTVVLAVKPQQVADALARLRPDSGSLLVSIAAGVRVATLQQLLGPEVAVVRSMPNTPALLGCGIAGLYAGPEVSQAARAAAEAVLAAAGDTCWVEEESQLDAVTAVSGSGPAYLFLLAELMTEAGVALGLAPAVAARLAERTVIGSARMLEHSGLPPATLREQVTSKGGTTAAALQTLQDGGIDTLFKAALARAAQRSSELGDVLAASILKDS